MAQGTLTLEDFVVLLKDKVARVAQDDFTRVKDKAPRVRDTVFNVERTRQPIFRRRGIGGAFYPSIAPDGTLAPISKIELLPEVVYRVVQYRRALVYTMEMMDDILRNPEVGFVQQGEILRKMLSDADDLIEDIAASVFINAFSATAAGPDGKALCATDHPLYLSTTGATYGNTTPATVSLSPDGLSDAYLNLAKTPDNSGFIRGLKPRYLLVPPDLERRAKEILHSELVPYSAENTTNIFANSVELIVWDRLTDAPNAWFVLTDKSQHSLYLFMHTDPTIVVDNQIDYKTRTLHTEVLTKFAVGFDDWRGVYGESG